MDQLGQIWELSDVDKDGFLDREEFTLVSMMYSVYNVVRSGS